MYKTGSLMVLYCETPLHAGSGSSLGVIDLPIQRERITSFPTVAGSGIKGAVREWFESHDEYREQVKESTLVFGPETADASDHAGAASFSDARLLLFPVRSMRGVFAWITCPAVLARFRRDLEMLGMGKDFPLVGSIENGRVAATEGSAVMIDNKVGLEEYTFEVAGPDPAAGVSSWLGNHGIVQGEFWQQKLKDSLVVLSDDDFSDFVQHSTEVHARIRIDNTTRTVANGALFYEEHLPAESVLYSPVLASVPSGESAGVSTAEQVMAFVRQMRDSRLQLAGDASTGRGMVMVTFIDAPGKEGK